MWIIITVVSILVVLALGFLLLCRFIGQKFLRNLQRRDPGDVFKADIDISFYQNSPHKLAAEQGLQYMKDLPREDVFISSPDGLRLHGTLFPSPDGRQDRIMLGIHGFQSEAFHEFAPYMAFYQSQGFTVLLADDRGHGQSEGPYITMGIKDRLDCVAWARYLADRFGPDCKILLHGVSMGAAAVVSASAEEHLPEQVIGIVSDCAYTSVQAQLDFQMKSLFHMPPALPHAVCHWFALHKAGFDFRTFTPLEQVRHARVPILFVQGAEDFLVPKEMARQLYNACGSRKCLLMVEGASHAESIAVAPDKYHRTILDFFQFTSPES